jgi:hypothetical protein
MTQMRDGQRPVDAGRPGSHMAAANCVRRISVREAFAAFCQATL